MILSPGNTVLVVHRRLYETDHSRFFIGTVQGYEGGIAKVEGYTWVRDSFIGKMQRKDGKRSKIFSLVAGTLIVYQVPDEVDPGVYAIETTEDGLCLRGPKGFKLDLGEGASDHRKPIRGAGR